MYNKLSAAHGLRKQLKSRLRKDLKPDCTAESLRQVYDSPWHGCSWGSFPPRAPQSPGTHCCRCDSWVTACRQQPCMHAMQRLSHGAVGKHVIRSPQDSCVGLPSLYMHDDRACAHKGCDVNRSVKRRLKRHREKHSSEQTLNSHSRAQHMKTIRSVNAEKMPVKG